MHRVLEGRGEEELPDGTLGTRYRFAHGLYQRVLYEDLVAPRRGELHRRAGELLVRHWGENAPSRAVEMAEHFERGRDIARAVRFRTLAGEHAVRRFAGAEAVEHYTAGLQLIHKQPSDEAAAARDRALRRDAPRPGCCSHASTRPLATTRSCSSGRARRACPAAELRGAERPVQRATSSSSGTTEMSARAREALQAAERLGSPHHLAEARGRVGAGARDGRTPEGGRAARSTP